MRHLIPLVLLCSLAGLQAETNEVVRRPDVYIAGPDSGRSLLSGSAVTFYANEFSWDDPPTEVERVEFIANGALLGRAIPTQYPKSVQWTFTWLHPQVGDYMVHAVSLNSLGQVAKSPPIFISIVDSISPGCPLEILWEHQADLGRGIGFPSDKFKVAHELEDGTWIFGGEAYSTSVGGWDYIAVLLDADGQEIWTRRLGGAANDQLFDLEPTADGGFLLAGWSSSRDNGDRTAPTFGNGDGWIVKLDADGQVLWDRAYGGSQNEGFYGIERTEDGGFILGGVSESPPSGNKTSPHFGHYDLFLVRIDADGNKIWDQTFGGDDREFWGRARALSDGGFVLFGSSQSDVSGNKSGPAYGGQDVIVGRFDSLGNLLWDCTLGGAANEYLAEAQETPDEDVLLVGWSDSEPDGNKTSPNYGSGDAWVVSLDREGHRNWERTYGGIAMDSVSSISPMDDGGYLLGGQSRSPISGTKTSPNIDGQDNWLIRIDGDGNQVWDRTVNGGSLWKSVPTSDGGILIAGDKWGPGSDTWAIKLGSPEADCDLDRDGVLDTVDQCLDTPRGAVVDPSGCSLEQFCPCTDPWPNHGAYVLCAVRQAWRFFEAGLITRQERRAFIAQAARSDCGRQHGGEPTLIMHSIPQSHEAMATQGYQFCLIGEPGQRCALECSSDLKNWEVIRTITLDHWETEITDLPAGQAPRFYRARLLP